MSEKIKGRSSARLGVILFALAALMSFGISFTLAAQPFKATMTVDSIIDHTVTISGTADSPSNAVHHMVIDWGDGTVDVLPEFLTDAPWNWGPLDHEYADAGTYTIEATLIHANDNGNDRGVATASSEVTIEDPCEVDCPGEDGTTDDGTTDDGSTDDGSTDGTVSNPPVVKGTKIVKKPLAKTAGADTTGLTVIGLMVLMAGATVRLLTTREDMEIVARANER